MACGMTRKAVNVEMSALMDKMSQTVFDTTTNTEMGDLLPALMMMLGKGKSTELVGYKPHRFMSMAATMQHILEKWPGLEKWYHERTAKSIRDRKPPPNGFPLSDCYQHLVQILSILTPIILVSKRAQAEDANQVQVLLTLYTVRMTALALDRPIRRFDTPSTKPVYFQPSELTPLVTKTRELLLQTFYRNFFRRYVDSKYITSGSYVFEMQLMLHLSVKHVNGPMDNVIEAVARKEGQIRNDQLKMHVSTVRKAIMKRLNALMRSVASFGEPPEQAQAPVHMEPVDVFADAIMEMFAVRRQPASMEQLRNTHEKRISEELSRWQEANVGLELDEDGRKPETILQFWRRQQEAGNYHYLPLVARIIFAVPSSSAQMERDFGNSGQMVTALRSTTSASNIDMSSFLHQNRSFVDVCQCPKLKKSEVDDNIPSNVTLNLEPSTIERMEWSGMVQDCFSMEIDRAFASDGDEETKEMN